MSNGKKLGLCFLGVFGAVFFVVICAYLTENNLVSSSVGFFLTFISMVLLFAVVVVAVKVDYSVGSYVCTKCGNKFNPTFNAYLFAPHIFSSRCLKCPECKNKSWCKKIIK